MVHDPWPWEGLADHAGQVPPEHLGILATAERAVVAAGAQRVAEEPWGLLLRSQFTPLVRDANQALVVAADAEPHDVLDAVELAAREDGLDHRQVRVDEASLVDAFRDAVAERWPRDAEVATTAVMLGVATPDRRVDTSDVRAVMLGELAGVLEAARVEQGLSPMVARQLATCDKRLGMALGEPAALGVLAHDDAGEVAGGAQVMVLGPMACIEEVNVLAAHRGRGLGRAVTQAALDLAASAGALSVFTSGDVDDWPWRLYARMGFATALVHTTLTLPAS